MAVGKALAALVAGHAAATVVSVRGGLTASSPATDEQQSGADGFVPAKAADAELVRLAKLETELYRGQPRWPRIGTSYAADCALETPLIAVQGEQAVTRCAKFWASLKPVQLAHREEYALDGKSFRVFLSTEVSLLSRTFLIPSCVEIELDDAGRVARHQETWHGNQLVPELHIVRQINGWILENLFAPK
ncbi:Hypothetical Protein FCC1311_013112 [Hondaea fermentalgiana]|uniref:Uncharacterized protein n=1 Tax=Hondaea fermentalgiana TaxID=2315210 RepID=A0A2R5GBI0_9STRA|nr:Hypothetical Protein FCC1311_013112 [Hondaea fermentalgiana]|eukprot:GBG25094.1 Hypothetical Protein FCC1311_013112 [Hondaea fermentalgiana]